MRKAKGEEERKKGIGAGGREEGRNGE